MEQLEEQGGGGTPMERAPRDAYNLTYIVHFFMGAATLLPWNALITAADYFSSLYPKKHVEKAFSVAYMGLNLVMLVALTSASSWNRKPSVRWKMNTGLSLYVCSLLVAPLMDWAREHHQRWRQGGAYGLTVSAVAVCGLADGLVAASLVGSTGELPKRYMQAVFVGNASSGVLVSILRIITKASLPQNPKGLRTSAHLYFIVSIVSMIGCIFCYNILGKLPTMQYYRCRKLPPSDHQNPMSPQGHESVDPGNSHCSTAERKAHPNFWDVWKRIQWLACGVSVIYIVTLSIFPGYITENVHSELLKDWYAILLIAAYNISDLVGKSLTAAYVPKGTKRALWACIARLVFYPLFVACLHGPKFFRTETPVIFLTCALGLTNGYLTSVLMILAPKAVPSTDSETAGTVMMTFLAIGLAGGAVLGWFWAI